MRHTSCTRSASRVAIDCARPTTLVRTLLGVSGAPWPMAAPTRVSAARKPLASPPPLRRRRLLVGCVDVVSGGGACKCCPNVMRGRHHAPNKEQTNSKERRAPGRAVTRRTAAARQHGAAAAASAGARADGRIHQVCAEQYGRERGKRVEVRGATACFLLAQQCACTRQHASCRLRGRAVTLVRVLRPLGVPSSRTCRQ